MTLRMHRRAIIAGLGAAASPLLLPRSMAQATGGGDPFTLGVAAGEPWPDGFVIWTRLAPKPLDPDGLGGLTAPVAVRWEIFADEGLRTLAASGQIDADSRSAHTVHVEVSGLQPNRPYWYRFTALGAQSPVGRAKTAPAPGPFAGPLTMTVASCAHYEVGWFSAYRHMAAENADLTLFLGDYIYEYSYRQTREDLVRRHDIQTDALTLADYRRRYALYKMDPDLQALHHSAAALITWDDHELHNDYAAWESAYPDMPPERFKARRISAYQAFYEHMPLRRRSIPRDGALRLYDRYRFGDLAEFAFLDGRQYKSTHACPDKGFKRGHVTPLSCPDFDDPTRTVLGREQEAWLYGGFKDSRARWNIMAQQSQFTPYIQTNGRKPEFLGEYTETWSVQGQSRQRLTDAIVGSKLANPVFFGGDIHAFLAADIRTDFKRPDSPVVASEFVGSSITSDKMPDNFADTLPMNPHVRYYENDHRGYYSATIRPDRLETRFRGISDRLDRNATVQTLRAFAVESGRKGINIV